MSGKAFVNMSPQIVQAFFCLVMQYAFTGHSQYPWTPDPRTSGIAIHTSMAENLKEAEPHPAILVEQGGLRFNNDSVGNRADFARHKEYLVKENLQFTVNGSMALHAVTESKLASENLAYFIASFLSLSHNSMVNTLQLQYLSMPQISPVRPINREGGDTTYDATVSVEYVYAVRKSITPLDLGPLLDDILLVPDLANPILGSGHSYSGKDTTGGSSYLSVSAKNG